jgi:hypothetical protein
MAFFGGWTVAYHFALLVGGSRDAALVFGLGLAAVAIGLLPAPPDPEPVEVTPDAAMVEPRWQLPLRLAGVGLVAVFAATGSNLFWPGAFLLSIWLLCGVPRSAGWRDHRGDHPFAAAWVVVLAIVAAFLSASVIRWTSDDSYYVNRALVISESSGPMPFGVDTIHSSGSFPSAEPDNDLTSWHPLAGVGADFAGTSARRFISVVAQPLVAALAVLAVWRAGGVLGARRPAFITTIVFGLCFLLAGVGGSIWYVVWASSSAKTTLAAAIAPLVLVYAVEAARRPGRRVAIRIAMAAIAGGGSSIVAAVVLPPIIGAGLLSARSRPFGREMRAVWTGALVGIAYTGVLFIIGLWSTRGLPSGSELGSVADLWTFGAVGLVAAPVVIGAITGLMFLAPVVASAAARRFAAFGLVLVLAFVVSPLALVYGGRGGSQAYRGAWALVPIVLVAVAIDGLLQRVPGVLAVAVILLLALEMGAPLSDLRFRVPAGDDLPVGRVTNPARALIAAAPGGSVIAGPLPVLGVVPAISPRVYPLVAQERYGASIQVLDPGFRHDERMSVIGALSTGRFEGSPERLGELFDQFGIGAVALSRDPGAAWIRKVLKEHGFERRGRERGVSIWSR